MSGASANEFVLSSRFVAREGRWLALDGLNYRGLPRDTTAQNQRLEHDLDDWIRMLRHSTDTYAAQPWQHLAAAHRAAGHEGDAKRVLIAQQDDRRDRVLRRKDGRYHPWLWFRRNVLLGGSKVFTGYGYRTSWTLGWLLGWTVLGITLGLATGWVHVHASPQAGQPATEMTAAAHGRLTVDPGSDCSAVERIGLGLAWGLPLIRTDASSQCVLNTTDTAGQWLTAASWTVQAGGWALATLVAAGYTGIVRRL